MHPLLAGEAAEDRLAAVERLAREGRIVAVGEAGMDRNAAAPMERQVAWFEAQVRWAAEYGLPVIVHGVRVVPELVAVAKRYMGKGDRWIVHGFNNRRKVLQELLRHGFYISVGRQLMNRESHAYRLLPEIPAERLCWVTGTWVVERVGGCGQGARRRSAWKSGRRRCNEWWRIISNGYLQR